jgi:hypothetical protein
MMAFCLGKLTDFPNKVERFPEIGESSGPSGSGGPLAASY